VKTYGETNEDMLFHKSAVFTIDSSLDMYVQCEDEHIIVRLVHAKEKALITSDLASSIRDCLISALHKISRPCDEWDTSRYHQVVFLLLTEESKDRMVIYSTLVT
jgi:hypothetical protein